MKRSDGVTIISIYFLISGLAELAIACAVTIPFFALQSEFGDDPGVIIAVLAAVTGLCFALLGGILSLASGWGLWQLKNWARWLAIVLAIVSLFGFPVGTVIGALIIWYLLKDEVREAFEGEEVAVEALPDEDALDRGASPEDTLAAGQPEDEEAEVEAAPDEPTGPVMPDEEEGSAGDGEAEEE